MQENTQGNQKKKKGCGCVTLVVLALVIGSCSMMFGSSDDNKKADTSSTTTTAVVESTTQDSTETTEATTEATTEEAKATTEFSEEDLYDTYIALVRANLDENFPDSFEIKKKDNIVHINIWQDGLAFEATLAKEGYEENKEKWEDMKDNAEYMSESLTKLMKTTGIKDGHVAVNVLNDQNKDNTLLSYLDGECVYDAMDE